MILGKVKNEVIDLSHLVVECPELRSVLTTIFAPFIKTALTCNRTICSSKIEIFNKKFKIESDILKILEPLKKKGIDFILAGGKMIHYFENKKIDESVNDYDIFVKSSKEAITLNDFFALESKDIFNEMPIIIYKPNLTEFFFQENNLRFQVMFEPYSCAEEVISMFDIRACAIATDGKKIYWMKNTLHDIRKKKLIFLNLRENKTVFLRIHKYQNYGYALSLPDMGLAALSFLLPMISPNNHALRIYLDREFDLSLISNYPDNREAENIDAIFDRI